MASFEDTFNNTIEGMLWMVGLGAKKKEATPQQASATPWAQVNASPVAANAAVSAPQQTTPTTAAPTVTGNALEQRVANLESDLANLHNFVNQINQYLHEQDKKSLQKEATVQTPMPKQPQKVVAPQPVVTPETTPSPVATPPAPEATVANQTKSNAAEVSTTPLETPKPVETTPTPPVVTKAPVPQTKPATPPAVTPTPVVSPAAPTTTAPTTTQAAQTTETVASTTPSMPSQ